MHPLGMEMLWNTPSWQTHFTMDPLIRSTVLAWRLTIASESIPLGSVDDVDSPHIIPFYLFIIYYII